MRRLTLVFCILASSAIFAQTGPGAAELWKELEAGNRLYAAPTVTDAQLRALREEMVRKRKATATSQTPRVTILSCADSRVPPELLFSQAPGDLFVIRTAGNVASELDLGTIEFAIARNEPWTKLIVVLAHEHCGAVAAALDPTLDEKALTPSLVALVTQIRESFTPFPGWTRGGVSLEAAAKANARHSANSLVARSSVIRNAVRGGVEIMTAYYTLENGVVQRFE